MQFATQAAVRVQEGTIGARAEEVAALHPPTITLSLTLGNISLPGADLACLSSMHALPVLPISIQLLYLNLQSMSVCIQMYVPIALLCSSVP